MFGTLLLSQHTTQYTDVKVYTELETSIHPYSRVVQQGILWKVQILGNTMAQR